MSRRGSQLLNGRLNSARQSTDARIILSLHNSHTRHTHAHHHCTYAYNITISILLSHACVVLLVLTVVALFSCEVVLYYTTAAPSPVTCKELNWSKTFSCLHISRSLSTTTIYTIKQAAYI
jgi:hypothetical protein